LAVLEDGQVMGTFAKDSKTFPGCVTWCLLVLFDFFAFAFVFFVFLWFSAELGLMCCADFFFVLSLATT